MFDGIWPGIVINNTDIKKRGRLQIRVPQVYGADESAEKIPNDAIPWALPCFPFVGKNSGIVFVPEIGSGIWVMFVGGDSRYPVWLGGWFADTDSLTEHVVGYLPAPSSYILKTPKRKHLLLNDGLIEEGILLNDGNGQMYQMFSTNGAILETALESKETVAKTIVSTASYSITMTTILFSLIATAATITTMGAIAVAAAGAIAITAAGAVTVTAATISLLAAAVTIGNVAQAQKLCNKAMLDLFNNHVHLYSPGPGSPTTTLPPTQAGAENTHTTKDLMGS